MTPHDLAALKARVLAAISNGQQIAKAQAYIDLLGGMKAPSGVAPGSVLHLEAAIAAYESGSTPAPLAPPTVDEGDAESEKSDDDSDSEDESADSEKPKKKAKKRK